MKTKKIKYTENMSVVFDKEIKQKMIELATKSNISQGEFVRKAVEFYINWLEAKKDLNKQKQEYKPQFELDFDKLFDEEFEDVWK